MGSASGLALWGGVHGRGMGRCVRSVREYGIMGETRGFFPETWAGVHYDIVYSVLRLLGSGWLKLSWVLPLFLDC
jgi:hypothetical protein